MSSYSNLPECFYYKPRLQLENWIDENNKLWYGIEEFAKRQNLFGMSGHMRLSFIRYFIL